MKHSHICNQECDWFSEISHKKNGISNLPLLLIATSGRPQNVFNLLAGR